MNSLLPDHHSRAFQRLALQLAKIGRQHPEVGPGDPDLIMKKLILRSLMAAPLLDSQRPIYDVGSGVGIPGIALALAMPECPVYLIEPKRRSCALARWLLSGQESSGSRVTVIESTLEKFDFSRLPPGQVVSRAALNLPTLLEWLPAEQQPVIKWAGDRPDFFPPDWRLKLRVKVCFSGIQQSFLWAGSPEMFHVKQKEWEQRAEISWQRQE